jgi:hypothetical protein
MTSLYTENHEKWKNLASIDYFTHFVKAWIPFNAWYKTYYPEATSDRQAINTIKSTNNKFRNKFISLLSNRGNEGFTFRSRIAELHVQLELRHISNKGDRITFKMISIEDNPRTSIAYSRNNLEYKVTRCIPNRKGEIEASIYDKIGSLKFNFVTNGFNTNELIDSSAFLTLSENQRKTLKACYEEINPSKPIDLLTDDTKNCIQMGNLHFVNNQDKLFKGTIEILYKLRNVLFHGEIIPDNETNRVYEPAYQILYILIQSL